MTQTAPKSNADLPQKQQWQLLIDTIANEKNAFSIEDVRWEDRHILTRYPLDSFKGKCGTPACVLGWAGYLELSILITSQIAAPNTENSNAAYPFNICPDWFTRAKTVAMLKHYVGACKWTKDDELAFEEDVDWLLDERESA